MSANERLDLDQLNRDFTDAVCSMRVPFNRLVANVLARIPRLIATVRERDAEIARLKAELEEPEEAESLRYCVSCGVFMDDEPSACEDEVVCDECADDLYDEDDDAHAKEVRP